MEKDFWLAFDLLRTPKDHAEFTIVRDWVRDALKVTDPFALPVQAPMTSPHQKAAFDCILA